eukprot:scaffold13.g268.t1
MGNCLGRPAADERRPPALQLTPAAASAAANGRASPRPKMAPKAAMVSATATAVPRTPPARQAPPSPPVPHAAQGPPPAVDAEKRRAMHKRIAVAAEAITNAADIAIPDIPKTEHAVRLIEQARTVMPRRATEDNLLFESLSIPAKQAIIRSMKPENYRAGEVIIQQGDPVANKFYVVERGTADVFLHREEWGEERKVASYQPGKGFGELALLYSAPRAATVRATTDCKLWAMERTVYAAIKRIHGEQVAREKRALLDRVPMLAVLGPDHKQLVAEALELVEFRAGAAVFGQGDPADKFYVIRDGTAVVTQDGKEVARLGEGAFFGEHALSRDEPRASAVRADTYLVCYALGRAAFNELLGPIEDVWRFESLRAAPVLVNLSQAQLFELARRMTRLEFKAGDVVFRKGDPGSTFYVVEEGLFHITDGGDRELAKCGKGQCFGERALLKSEPRAANVTALTDAKALACTREDFNRHLGCLTEIANLWRFEALKKVPLLAPLTHQQRLALCKELKSVEVKGGTAVVKRGEEGNTFYVIEKGSCVVLGEGDQELATLGPTACFGERALLLNEPRAATVVASGPVSLLALDRGAFTRLLGPLQALLERQATSYDVVQAVPKIRKALKPEDFKHVAVLGAGAFGRVTLVKYEGRHYALKSLSKAHVIATGLQARWALGTAGREHIKREKAVMAEFASPFLVGLVTSFKDASCLYMVLELVQGGEFFTYLQSREAPLSEPEARFYAGCVILGLEYMHDRSIAWRDLKPENLLLDTSGYLKVTDFGFAKKIPGTGKSYTLCGTPEYLSPELVSQAGHGRAVDWWAVGVLVFEMVAGHPPFYQEDRVAMFRAICNAQYAIPAHFSRVTGPDDISHFEVPSGNPAKRNSRYVSTGVFADF